MTGKPVTSAAEEEAVVGALRAPATRPLLGFILVLGSVGMSAAHASLSKVLITTGGITPMRLSEARSLGCAVILFVALFVLRRSSLRLSRGEILPLVLFGVVGVGLGQFLFYTALERIDIGVALVIVYLAPVLVAAWTRLVHGEPLRLRLWAALGLGLAGLSLVVELWTGLDLDGAGVAAALAGAIAYAVYVVGADTAVRRGRDALSVVAWGFLFATLFWSVVQPWWSYPGDPLGREVSLLGRLDGLDGPVWLLLIVSVVLGTAVPIILFVKALEHLAATRTIIAAMLEPVFGAFIAFAWLDERLSRTQIAGGLLVLAGVAVAQRARALPAGRGPG